MANSAPLSMANVWQRCAGAGENQIRNQLNLLVLGWFQWLGETVRMPEFPAQAAIAPFAAGGWVDGGSAVP